MKARINDFLNQLSERDRIMLLVGGVIVCCYLLYALLYAPLTHAVFERRQQLIEKQATYAWMQQVRPQAHLKKELEVLEGAQLLTVVSDKLKSTSFRHYPYQLQQAGPKEIQLSFEEVPYNACITWLSWMNQHYAFSIKQLHVERGEVAGVVKLLLVIEVA